MILTVDVMPSQRRNKNPHLPWIATNLRGASVERHTVDVWLDLMNRVHIF